MPRFFTALVAAVLLGLLLWPVAAVGAQSLDCTYFRYQEQAQVIYDEDPTDPNGLDADGNGIACEELPVAGDSAPLPEPGDDNDLDCVEFAFQEDAQSQLDGDPSDPFGLDPDGDGVACGRLPSILGSSAPIDTSTGDPTDPAADPILQTGDPTCADFDFREDAQAELDLDPTDPFGLDPDGNGQACDELPSVNDPTDPTDTTTGAAQTPPACRDFEFQEEAQAQLESDPTNPGNLDNDGNGIACERLPSNQDAQTPTTTAQTPPECRDFEFQEEAQAQLESDPTNPGNLDNDGNGIACERLPSNQDAQPAITTMPATGVGTTAEEHPRLGWLVLLGVVVGLAVACRPRVGSA